MAFGENVFVPQIMFVLVDGELRTTCVWTDAIPMLLPEVDSVTNVRIDLAPRSWLGRRKQDMAMVDRASIAGLLERQASFDQESNAHLFRYDHPPAEVVDFVKSLPAMSSELVRLPNEEVLNEELIPRG